MKCTIETVQINEDRNVIVTYFCGNLWWELQTDSHSIFKQFLLCIFCIIHSVLNYKVLPNFSSGYPLTITRDFPVHNTFCWVFPIRDASLTCPGVTVLFKKIRGNLKNFAVQLGDQGGRGEESSKVAQSPPSNLCVCVCVCVLLSMLGGGTATISILNQECVLMSIFGGGATISIFNCVCVLMSMLGGGTAIQQQSPYSTVYVCSCPCLSPP